MNFKKLTTNIALMAVLLLLFSACDIQDSLELTPHDGVSNEEAIESVDDMERVTQGNYALIINESGGVFAWHYPRQYHEMIEMPGDNVTLPGTTIDPLFEMYTYASTSDQPHISNIWNISYKVIYGANTIIRADENGDIQPETPAEEDRLDQVIGENYFLRALMHFNLANAYAPPYTHGENNPAVPYIDIPGEQVEQPERNTVGEVYDRVIEDLERSSELMNEPKSNAYASSEVADALLSRVYLYMEENEKAIEYADRVIDSGRYNLVESSEYPDYFHQPPENNPETIFAYKHTSEQDREFSAIGSMYFTSEGGTGWGEMFPSKEYRELLHEDDLRWEFIQEELDEDGEPIMHEGQPTFYMTKYAHQTEDEPLLSSPVVLRKAEMYLNRAEANAKLGNESQAIEDVNLIRSRAGLQGDQLYSTGDLGEHDTVLDVVLEERRLELAFESHRSIDVFRNHRTMERDYPGSHQQHGAVTIEPDDPRIVYPLPEREVDLNPNL